MKATSPLIKSVILAGGGGEEQWPMIVSLVMKTDFPEAPADRCLHFSGQHCVTRPALAVMEAGKGVFNFPPPLPWNGAREEMAGNGMGGQLKNGYFNNHTGLFEEVGRRCKGVGGLHQLCHVPRATRWPWMDSFMFWASASLFIVKG